jgi:hypothetical protein
MYEIAGSMLKATDLPIAVRRAAKAVVRELMPVVDLPIAPAEKLKLVRDRFTRLRFALAESKASDRPSGYRHPSVRPRSRQKPKQFGDRGR